MYQKSISFILFVFWAVFAQSQDLDKLSKKVDKFFNKYVSEDRPGGAVVAVKNGEIVFKKAYGLADYENKVPLTNSSVLDVASVSKQFLGYAVAKLEMEGKLTLQDDVKSYISEFPDFGYTVTIGHLLFHQSGLRDWPATMKLAGVGFEDVLTFDQILAMVYQQETLNFEPGTKHIYSNTGYNVLVEVIQRITQQSFRDWTTENIFQPLGMENTFFKDQFNASIPNGVKSYFKEDEEVLLGSNNLIALGSSSLQITIDDFGIWLQHLDSEEAKDLMRKMQVPGSLPATERAFYAYGLEVNTYGGLRQIYHDGSWASFNSYMAYFPDQHFSVAVLLNHANWAEGFGQGVIDIYLEDEFKEDGDEPDFYDEEKPEINTSLDLDYSNYTGIYYLEKYLVYLDITEEDGKLYVQATDEDRQLMEPVLATRFWVDAYDGSIYFNQNSSGEIESATYHQSLCPKRESIPSKEELDMPSYEGHYYSRELNTSYQVKWIEGQLTLSNLRNGEISLNQIWKDGFMTDKDWVPIVDFQRNETGEVISFTASQYRSRNQAFYKLD